MDNYSEVFGALIGIAADKAAANMSGGRGALEAGSRAAAAGVPSNLEYDAEGDVGAFFTFGGPSFGQALR